MARIFLNYKTDDAPRSISSFVATELKSWLGRDRVFHDSTDLCGGDKWRKKVGDNIDACDLMIACIGSDWIDLAQRPRKEGDEDAAIWEIERALARELRVIPVLTGTTTIEDLKASPIGSSRTVKSLLELTAFQLREDHLHRDTEALIRTIWRGKPDRWPDPERTQRRWKPTFLAVLVAALAGLVVLYTLRWRQDPGSTTKAAGAYVKFDVRAGQLIERDMIDEVPDRQGELTEDLPLTFESHLRGGCFVRDLRSGHRLRWEDVGLR
ncbi:MAG: toll/interleukin-1 receptor domain-containing protein [Planctomycetes bacterium]|nr:toll/interleukin-1 receptor domain-containing protein [Planctomycetota bacterium]